MSVQIVPIEHGFEVHQDGSCMGFAVLRSTAEEMATSLEVEPACACGGGYFVLGSTDGHRADCASHRRSALVTCPHEWTERGGPGDAWRECWLCGAVEDE